MKINEYINGNVFKILSESYKWRNRDLLEKNDVENPKLTFRKILFSNKYYLIISLVISLFVKNLFIENITTFLMTSLSIFIGLFISILILIFDKFLNHNENYNKKVIENKIDNSDLKLNFIRTRNFTRRFVFVLLESLIIAFTTIILLLITLTFNKMFLRNLTDYEFTYFKSIDYTNVVTFFQNVFTLIVKTLIMVLMIRFCVFLFFLFGALGEYMKGVLYGKVTL